ncbi:MAG: phosphoribosylglycinamide formyltransferase [Marinifilaceae bacterium]
MKRIAVFASGSGSNAENIARYFQEKPIAEVSLILSNNSHAFVLERADNLGISTHVFTRHEFYETDEVVKILKKHEIDLVVLAGFLWLIPQSLIRSFPNRIVNIHPALLPKYGGKGMYGMKVHQTVIESGDCESGITIHMVNEKYDEGKILFQGRCSVESDDTPEDLAQKVHELEYEYYPKIIEQLL